MSTRSPLKGEIFVSYTRVTGSQNCLVLSALLIPRTRHQQECYSQKIIFKILQQLKPIRLKSNKICMYTSNYKNKFQQSAYLNIYYNLEQLYTNSTIT